MDGVPPNQPVWCAPGDQDCNQYKLVILDKLLSSASSTNKGAVDLMAGERGSLEIFVARVAPRPLTPWELAMRHLRFGQ